MSEKPKHPGGRPRKGTLELRGKSWHARFTVTVEGESMREWWDTLTNDERVARRRMAREQERRNDGAVPTLAAASAEQTVDEYAAPFFASRRARGVSSVAYEEGLYAHVWRPAIGDKTLSSVTAADFNAVLDDALTGKLLPAKRKGRKTESKPYGHQSLTHIRAVAFRIFQAAWREELIPRNRVANVGVPEMEESRKPRAVLADSEIKILCVHPDVDPEIKMLVLLSRTIGGLRGGDLNHLDWSSFSPGFATCTFVRRKTRKKKAHPKTHEVPIAIRPVLAGWWAAHGQPATGPVFPARRGERAGAAKKTASYANRLRRELLKAGVDRHELHHETPNSLPVDFHSTRRAFGIAAVGAGMTEQQIMKAGEWSSSQLVARYSEAGRVHALPPSAVPDIGPETALQVALKNRPKLGAKLLEANHELAILRCRSPDLNRGQRAYEARALTN
jgi:integrase